MGVSRILEKPSQEKTKLSEAEIEALINKGAPVKEDKIEVKEKDNPWAHVLLRISKEMLQEVDKCVSNRVGISRTGWLLEAIDEKIKREQKP